MRRSTAAISLALVGSALIVGSCSQCGPYGDRRHGGGGYYGGARVGPIIGRSFGGGSRGGSPSAGVSARGGFGRIGGGFSAGS